MGTPGTRILRPRVAVETPIVPGNLRRNRAARLRAVSAGRGTHRSDLKEIARRAMTERGLWPDFSRDALAELDRLHDPAPASRSGLPDLRKLPWVSIDNDDSRDLDQLSCAEELPKGAVRIRVAVADVDALVKDGSALDGHARHNTTSVYTAATIFPMLPEKLS